MQPPDKLIIHQSGGRPTIISVGIRRQDQPASIKRWCSYDGFQEAEGLKTRCYAISVQRKLKHPAGAAIAQAAREKVFAEKVPTADGDGHA